jgi:predicted DNA-binding protein
MKLHEILEGNMNYDSAILKEAEEVMKRLEEGTEPTISLEDLEKELDLDN